MLLFATRNDFQGNTLNFFFFFAPLRNEVPCVKLSSILKIDKI